MSSGALTRQFKLNTFASRSKNVAVAAAAAAAKHDGRTAPFRCSAATASIAARNLSSVAGGVGGSTTSKNNCSNHPSTRNRFSTRCCGHETSGAAPSATARQRDGKRRPAASTRPRSILALPSPTGFGGSDSINRGREEGDGTTRRASSSIASTLNPPPSPSPSSSSSRASSSSSPAAGPAAPTTTPAAAPSSLLAPAARAAAFSSSSLLAPSAAAYNGLYGGIGGGGGPTRVDAVVVGAGQAGLSVAYHLQKAGGLRVVTLDANQEPGGAWRHRWPSLELFSTRKWSSLPGYPMFANGASEDGYPSTGEMALYMEEYESVMRLNVVRPVKVTGVTKTAMGTFLVETDCSLGGTAARWEARTVISAAGTHASPVWPRLPGSETFRGTQIHSSQYFSAQQFRGKRVAVVGAGNSGAQILAEISAPGVASSALWSTLGEPSFLPMGLSGKEIFDTVARLRQKQGFVREADIPSLHSIIMQPGVIEAAERGVYDQRVPPLTSLTPTGVVWDASPDGSIPAGRMDVDAIIWCTGYRSNTSHLARLGLVQPDSTVGMTVGEGEDMGETEVPGVFAVGYGNWAGVGSGSIPGSTVYAKRAAAAAVQHLLSGSSSAYNTSKTRSAEAVATAGLTGRFPSGAWASGSRGSGGGGGGGGGRAGAASWPTAGRTSARAAAGVAAAATASGAPVPPAMQAARYVPPQQHVGGVEEERVAVAA